MIASILVYAGLVIAFLGGVSVIKPLRWLGIATRILGALLLAGGIGLAIAGFSVPLNETRVTEARSRLDEFVPVYQFSEIHSIHIAAPRDRVYDAIKSVTADEVPFYRALTWVRRFGRSGKEGLLNPAPHVPLLQTALRSGFILLAEEPVREIVLGGAVAVPPGFRPNGNPTPADFKAAHEPGFALTALNFRVEEAGPADCTVTTETRVFATDDATLRRFSRYWRLIYPGSALIRRGWLRAVKRRAEKSQ